MNHLHLVLFMVCLLGVMNYTNSFVSMGGKCASGKRGFDGYKTMVRIRHTLS